VLAVLAIALPGASAQAAPASAHYARAVVLTKGPLAGRVSAVARVTHQADPRHGAEDVRIFLRRNGRTLGRGIERFHRSSTRALTVTHRVVFNPTQSARIRSAVAQHPGPVQVWVAVGDAIQPVLYNPVLLAPSAEPALHGTYYPVGPSTDTSLSVDEVAGQPGTVSIQIQTAAAGQRVAWEWSVPNVQLAGDDPWTWSATGNWTLSGSSFPGTIQGTFAADGNSATMYWVPNPDMGLPSPPVNGLLVLG
jgi:hypothetical protein